MTMRLRRRLRKTMERYAARPAPAFVLTDTEIGRLLGITNDAVRKTRLRAERKLRELLRDV